MFSVRFMFKGEDVWRCIVCLFGVLVISLILTANEHDTDGEDLLWVGIWWYVSKAHTGQTAECEIQRCHILVPDWGAWGVVTYVVLLANGYAQIIQPANGVVQIKPLHIADRIPYASQPMGNESKDTHQEHKNSRPILWVSIQFTSHTNQSEQSGSLQQANQSCGLKRRWEEHT